MSADVVGVAGGDALFGLPPSVLFRDNTNGLGDSISPRERFLGEAGDPEGSNDPAKTCGTVRGKLLGLLIVIAWASE